MKVLIVRVGAMGDVLHGLPAVAALRNAMPEVEIGWVIEPRWEPLLRSADGNAPVVQRVHRAATKQWSKAPLSTETLKSVRALRRELRAEKYDLCIDLQGSIRSAVIGKMAAAKRFVGMAAPREKQARWFYNEHVKLRAAHVVEQAAEIVSSVMGVAVQPVSPTPLPVDTKAAQWAETLLSGETRPIAFVAPQAGWGAKQWPAERYGAVANALCEMGVRVLVNAVPNPTGSGGDELAAEVVTASNGLAEPVECSVTQMIALMRHVDLFIGGDTGPLHMAAALGVKVVGLYGPTDPARNGPWGTKNIVLRDASSVTNHRRFAEAEAGLMRIGVDDVVGAARRLLQETIEG